MFRLSFKFLLLCGMASYGLRHHLQVCKTYWFLDLCSWYVKSSRQTFKEGSERSPFSRWQYAWLWLVQGVRVLSWLPMSRPKLPSRSIPLLQRQWHFCPLSWMGKFRIGIQVHEPYWYESNGMFHQPFQSNAAGAHLIFAVVLIKSEHSWWGPAIHLLETFGNCWTPIQESVSTPV